MIYQETEKHVIPECRTPVQSKRNSSPLTSILSICRYTGVGMIVPSFSSRQTDSGQYFLYKKVSALSIYVNITSAIC